MTLRLIVAAILGLAVLVATVRLILWHRAAGDHGARLRLALLLLLQPVCAILLFLGLFPPAISGGSDNLRVATAGASRFSPTGAPLIVLPEAGNLPGEAVPDLATALRRHPSARSIEIFGQGLTPRDIDAARQVAVRFNAPPPPKGIINLAVPTPTAPGATFTVGGTLSGLPHASLELVDPAGRVTDSGAADGDGHFTLTGTTRADGVADFTLRIRDGNRIIEQATVPVIVRESAKPRLLILAGAPGPEVKYLRRWAIDAGFAVTTQMSAGGGIQLGDAPVSIDSATLRRFDAVLVDDRSWAVLGAQRNALLGAVRDGLGLILRPSGPLDGPTRNQWQALGFTLQGKNEIAPLALPKPPAAAITRTRQGIAEADRPDDLAMPDDMLPDISRLAATPSGRDTVPLLQDAGGTSLAAWRALGTGRMALFTGIDSYALTLTGRQPLFDQWWRSLLSAVARPAPAPTALDGIYWTGERMILCSLPGEAQVERPEGGRTGLIPLNGCAAFWPTSAGWHLLRTKDGVTPFHVQLIDALPAMRAARDRDATLMLRGDAPANITKGEQHPGPAWPFLLAWLAASALLWALERSRIGRRQPAR
ncbi:carboxypeptidase regulatory-like domain-containing protein [Sphingobium sp. BYY-5]|uniref:carboxypeptidase regulatory-like domain-containing protein n=1 Tax=Sphingobium sp. BYY-5 TaxID=2926400 RepID=UPI001FA759FF|nr:carboxypeptidase regulatory-like domain-containing protein [Sphingobium sp. BYY-5]MCI4589315.1 carboxypeptidase regulatory-like domain-containing protein [Sphingobium sp. BYY-5]